MPGIRYGQSIWLDQSKSKRPAFPKLSRSYDIPIAIVGGGLTGVRDGVCAGRGRASRRAVRGGSAGGRRNGAGGRAAAGDSGRGLPAARKTHGRKAARALWQDTRRAALDAQATLRRLNIKCGLRPADAIMVARTDAEAKALKRELAAAKEAGLDGSWIAGNALTTLTGIEGAGGMKTAGHASLDPHRAAVGLAKAAQEREAPCCSSGRRSRR